MTNHSNTLKEYRDKTYIYQILSLKTTTFYNRIKQIVQLPIILISSIMAIINSTFPPNDLQVANVILNGTVAFFMNLIGTYQIAEKVGRFKSVSQKFSQLLHLIEDKINNNNCDVEDVRDITRIYDELLTQCDDIPQFICDRVRRQYNGKLTLPVVLNGDSPSTSRPLSETQEVIICDLGSVIDRQL
jgi:hypothetical protein